MKVYDYLLKTREGFLLVALIGMILIEYMMLYTLLFSEYKLLSFVIMLSTGVLALKSSNEFFKEISLKRGVSKLTEQLNKQGVTNG